MIISGKRRIWKYKKWRQIVNACSETINVAHTTQGPKGIPLLHRVIDIHQDGPELAA